MSSEKLVRRRRRRGIGGRRKEEIEIAEDVKVSNIVRNTAYTVRFLA